MSTGGATTGFRQSQSKENDMVAAVLTETAQYSRKFKVNFSGSLR